MYKGDISNKVSPSILVDIDGLIIGEHKEGKFGEVLEKSKVFKTPLINNKVKNYIINEEAFHLFENLIYKDIVVNLFAHRNRNYYIPLMRLLEDYPFNNLYVGGAFERERVLRWRSVHYYYFKLPQHAATFNKKKSRNIDTIAQISLQ